MPQPIQSSSEIQAIWDAGVASTHSLPVAASFSSKDSVKGSSVQLHTLEQLSALRRAPVLQLCNCYAALHMKLQQPQQALCAAADSKLASMPSWQVTVHVQPAVHFVEAHRLSRRGRTFCTPAGTSSAYTCTATRLSLLHRRHLLRPVTAALAHLSPFTMATRVSDSSPPSELPPPLLFLGAIAPHTLRGVPSLQASLCTGLLSCLCACCKQGRLLSLPLEVQVCTRPA